MSSRGANKPRRIPRWRRPAARGWRAARARPGLTLGALILVGYLAIALLAQVWTPYDPRATLVAPRLAPPSAAHWFGADRVGADVFSRTLAATALDLRLTVVAVGLACGSGTALGALVGYAGGWVDLIGMRLLDVLQAFPPLLLAMVIVQALGPGEANVVAVLALIGAPFYARLLRAEVRGKRRWGFAEAARASGATPLRVALRHVLPNAIGPAIAYTTVNAAWVVLVTAALGFLGVGIDPGRAEWGAMIARGQAQVVTGEWWVSFFPGLFTFGLAAGWYLLGDGLRDLLDRRGGRP